jgi:hypothetical protein
MIFPKIHCLLPESIFKTDHFPQFHPIIPNKALAQRLLKIHIPTVTFKPLALSLVSSPLPPHFHIPFHYILHFSELKTKNSPLHPRFPSLTEPILSAIEELSPQISESRNSVNDRASFHSPALALRSFHP